MKTLNAWLELLEKRHPRAIDLGLERCGTVYQQLGSPRPAKQVITVAGTNGKGSTVAYMAALSGCLGQRFGTYTSPHILRFNERISIMGKPVSDQLLIDAFSQVEAVRNGVSLTYFEFTTLAALLILQQSKLDCAVLEVGLGGRLDTVNLVDTDCAVITPIGLDHQDFLGPDLNSIATEKAGIIRAGIPVVCTQKHPPEPVLKIATSLQARVYRRGFDFDLIDPGGSELMGVEPEAKTDASNAPLNFSLGAHSFNVPRPPMEGRHQLDNLAAALAALVLMNPGRIEQNSDIANAVLASKIPGRLQKVNSSPSVLVDVGHNTLAADAVAGYLLENDHTEVICVLGMLEDKPAEQVAIALDRHCARWICAGSPGVRGQSGSLLAERIGNVLPVAQISSAGSVDEAMEEAMSYAEKVDTILVFGSFSTVASALNWLQKCN